VLFASYGITGGSLVIDETEKQRSKVATTLAHVYKLRDKESGGSIWGQSLVFLVLVTPTSTIPLGFAFYQPAPALSAWYKPDKRLKQQGIPPKQRPPKPPPNPHYPTKQARALCLLRQWKAPHPALRVSCLVAEALDGAATFVEAASAIVGGVQVISQLRSNQKVRVDKHAQDVADYLATHPGTLQHIRIRGGEEISVLVGSARMYVCAHHPKRFIMALKYEGADSYRSLLASDLTWRTLDIVQG